MPITVAGRRLLERGRQLGGRPGRNQHLVDLPQSLELLGRSLLADQVFELGRVRHLNSSSSWSASRASALRVRVFTVPSGIPTSSAISLCESSLQ
jgi:hypothetical protein